MNRCILYLTQDWNGLGRSHYSSRTQINAGGQYGATIRVTSWLKSGLQLLGRYGTRQESISRRPEQVYLPSDPRLEWPGEGPLFEFNLNKCWAKCRHYSSHPWAIIYVTPVALGQVRHQCKSLSYVAEYV